MGLYTLLSAGSKDGNSLTLFNDIVLVDAGVKTSSALFKKVAPSIQYVLLTHEHTDHTHFPTLNYLLSINPSIKLIGGEFMQRYMNAKYPGKYKLEIVEAGMVYQFGPLVISPFKLAHDVPNFGYHIFYNNNGKYFKTIYMTDSGEYPSGLSAPNYDAYFLEINYDDNDIDEEIKKEQAELGYSHRIRSKETHLSKLDTLNFVNSQWTKTDSQPLIVPLHPSDIYRSLIFTHFNIKDPREGHK